MSKNKKSIWKEKWFEYPYLRPYMLLFIAISLFMVIYRYWDYINFFLTRNKDILPPSLITALVASPFAYTLWWWRNRNKLKDQEHVERELKLKENNDAWDNFTKFQKMALAANGEPDEIRATAIYALGEYYLKSLDSNFPQQVHNFFRMSLDNYWKNKDDAEEHKDLPCWIIAIHKVIEQKSMTICEKRLDCKKINLYNANLNGSDFKKGYFYIAIFGRAYLHDSNFQGAMLLGADFEESGLVRVNFENAVLAGACFKNARLWGANLTNVRGWEDAIWTEARYNSKTKFPNGMNPEKLGMKYSDPLLNPWSS